jgi:hypothetical protein
MSRRNSELNFEKLLFLEPNWEDDGDFGSEPFLRIQSPLERGRCCASNGARIVG